MKKNITINLFGQLYAIDEDAYQMLECYLESMKKYFARQEGGEEIADDIEHRVAELLWERRQQGLNAVDLEMVKAIIKQIGNPDEIDGQGSQSGDTCGPDAPSGDDEHLGQTLRNGMYAAGKATRSALGRAREHVSSRRFYRIPNDQILGGVCSGMAQYCGGQDPLLWRLGMVLLSFVSCGLACLLYLILWVCAPVACTPEDRLRMQGKEVNKANLSEQILNDSKEEPTPKRSNAVGVLSGIVRAFAWLVGMVVLCAVVLPCTICVPLLALAVVAMVGVALGFGETMISIPAHDVWVLHFYQEHWMATLGALACGLLVTLLPIYGFVRMMRSHVKPLSVSAKLGLVMLWIAALVVGISLACVTAFNFEQLTH